MEHIEKRKAYIVKDVSGNTLTVVEEYEYNG